MPVAATSLKLPRKLKSRIDRLARQSGESPHAFMLRALESQVAAAERYQAFLEKGQRADAAMQRSDIGYAADDVHAYLSELIAGCKNRVLSRFGAGNVSSKRRAAHEATQGTALAHASVFGARRKPRGNCALISTGCHQPLGGQFDKILLSSSG